MTTINLTPEQEAAIRRYKGADCTNLSALQRIVSGLADQLPDPLRVGDRVIVKHNPNFCGPVLAIYGDYAWVAYDGSTKPAMPLLTNLERA